MTNFIPIFPLSIVVYPEEQLNLHIFEPRYKQLIQECVEQKRPFGVPAVIDDKLQDFGTLVYIDAIAKTYDNGEMDIKTHGKDVFKILEVIRQVPDKLYSGAIVTYPTNDTKGSKQLMKLLVSNMRALHSHLQVKKEFKKAENELTAYDIAHHCGLSIYEEYELLKLVQERVRQEYLKRHFERTLPVFEKMDELKAKIKLNGHFRNLSGFDIQ